MSNYDKVKDWRKNTKLRLVEAFGGKCGICGYNKSVRALSFHHLDPNEKEISFTGRCVSWIKIVEEARKCVMLCSNCHMEVHDGVTKIPEDIIRFNEDYETYIPEPLRDKCPICGTLKPASQKTCSVSCGSKQRYKVNWDKYNLRELYNKAGSIVGVAKLIGNVSDNSVRKRMKQQGII